MGRRLRGTSSQNVLLVTLVKLKTGLGTRVIAAWTGIPYPELCRIFVTWVSFLLDAFFNSEFPVPLVES